MDSDPGLDVLSAPYLIIALIYSIVMACIFAFTLGDSNQINKLYSKSNSSGMYMILSINVVGCLVLMSAFYVIGVVYFSRWALVLFWGISSLLIMMKKGVVQNYLSKEEAKSQLGSNVLVIGDGDLAKEYINSAFGFPFLGRNIVGYVKIHEDEELGESFNRHEWSDKDDVTEKLACFGNISDLKNILKETAADEIVLALENVPGYKAEHVMHTVQEYRKQKPVNLSMLTPYGNLIPTDSTFYEFGETKAIDLDGNRRKGRSAFALGAILSAALLMIMMILNLFRIGEFQRFRAYESYKCVIFAVFGIFLFSMMMSSFAGKRWANTKRAVITAVCCLVFAIVYEVIYTGGLNAMAEVGAELWDFLADDIRAVGISVVICWCVSGVIKMIEKDYPVTM